MRRSGFDILLRRPWLPCEGRRVRRMERSGKGGALWSSQRTGEKPNSTGN
nr:MAG TPA: hypothetical protein [Caudoviricetes sp.]